jgi:hypothetical protein
MEKHKEFLRIKLFLKVKDDNTINYYTINYNNQYYREEAKRDFDNVHLLIE